MKKKNYFVTIRVPSAQPLIDALMSVGGRNDAGYKGEDFGRILYINPASGTIEVCSLDTKDQLVASGYEELGTVAKNEEPSYVVGIPDIGEEVKGFSTPLEISIPVNLPGNLIAFDEDDRPVTEINLTIKERKWKPKKGEDYFHLVMENEEFGVRKSEWKGGIVDEKRYSNGNCFFALIDALRALEKANDGLQPPEIDEEEYTRLRLKNDGK